MHYWNDGGTAGWGMWVAMAVMMTVVVIAVAWVVVTLVRHGGVQAGHAASPAPSATTPAVDILDERFARGEIEADEYLRRRTLLREGASPAS